MTTTKKSRTNWILLAAIAAVPVAGLTAPAWAQYQSDQRGNALDANRRIGDERSNDVSRSYRLDNRVSPVYQPTGNQITIQAPDAGDPVTEVLLVVRSASGTFFCLGQLPNNPVYVRGQGDWSDVNTAAGCDQGW